MTRKYTIVEKDKLTPELLEMAVGDVVNPRTSNDGKLVLLKFYELPEGLKELEDVEVEMSGDNWTEKFEFEYKNINNEDGK